MTETAVSASSAAKPSATEASSMEIVVFYFLAKISIVSTALSLKTVRNVI